MDYVTHSRKDYELNSKYLSFEIFALNQLKLLLSTHLLVGINLGQKYCMPICQVNIYSTNDRQILLCSAWQ